MAKKPWDAFCSRSSRYRTKWRKVFAVFSIAVLVLSVVTTPIGAVVPNTNLNDGRNVDASSANVAGSGSIVAAKAPLAGESLPSARAPRTTFAMIRDEIATIETNSSGRQSHLDRAKSEFGTAVSTYENPVEADLESLLSAAQGTRALRAFVTAGNDPLTDDQRASIEQSTSLAVRATNTTARWQLESARRRLAARKSELSNGRYRSLKAAIRNAERAYERAERIRDRISPGNDLARTLNQRARVITQYRVGWQQASQVLARTTAPENRSDADGDGITDVREHRLGTNATLGDTDIDGIDDGRETADRYPIDTDQDGTIDALDGDSDADGLPDFVEGTNDTDGDTVPDFRDADDDGDSIPTRTEVKDAVVPSGDRDFDGTANW